jgi:hypothetical protein
VNYPAENNVGRLYFETNRRVLYGSIEVQSTGTVNTSGTAVTWVSGGEFQPNWANRGITINGVTYTVTVVTSAISLTIASSAGVQAGVAYSQGRTPEWLYLVGEFPCTQSTIPTLGSLDGGMIIQVTDYGHRLKWTFNGTTNVWDWAPGEPGSGMIQFFDVAPTGVGWKLIDGLGDDGSPIGASHPIKILNGDGTLRDNTTAAAMNAGVYARGAAAYNGAVTAATAPTGAGVTGSTTPGAGSGPSATTGTTAGATLVAASGHTHTGAAHTHTIAAITLAGDPVAFTDWLPYIRK